MAVNLWTIYGTCSTQSFDREESLDSLVTDVTEILSNNLSNKPSCNHQNPACSPNKPCPFSGKQLSQWHLLQSNQAMCHCTLNTLSPSCSLICFLGKFVLLQKFYYITFIAHQILLTRYLFCQLNKAHFLPDIGFYTEKQTNAYQKPE